MKTNLLSAAAFLLLASCSTPIKKAGQKAASIPTRSEMKRITSNVIQSPYVPGTYEAILEIGMPLVSVDLIYFKAFDPKASRLAIVSLENKAGEEGMSRMEASASARTGVIGWAFAQHEDGDTPERFFLAGKLKNSNAFPPNKMIGDENRSHWQEEYTRVVRICLDFLEKNKDDSRLEKTREN